LKIKKSVFNDVYLPFLDDDSRYLVFYGGAGSGKSVFIAQRYIYRLLTRPLCNVLVVRQVAETNRDSTFALLTQVINRWGLTRYFKINRSNLQIVCTATGNTIIFKGLDDPEKLKSITFPRGELTEVWIEEATEALEESLNQLDFRLRGGNTKKQTVLSFNPISVNHWLKKRFFDKKSPKVKVLKTTYKDNKFLSKEDIELYESYKEIDPYYYAVYCLGEWGVYGKTVFKAINVQEQLNKEIKPVKVGYFDYDIDGDSITNIKFIEDEDGYIKIYEDAVKGHPYVVGGDTSGEGSDWFIGAVIDNATKKQVAVLRHQFDEDIYSNQMYCLGKYYNDALLSVEANYSTYPVKRLEMLKYRNQYVREREDTYTHKIVQSFGYKTTKLTRPVLIAGLVEIVREKPELIVDKETLLEMLTFVRNEKGRPEAQNGAHDDCIMALGIAYITASQQSEEIKEEAAIKKVKWEADQWEDYERGTDEERKMMIELWGNPM
jgi:phage terminase large subunit